MNVVIFGASGTIGYGVIMASLEDPRVESILSIGRSTLDVKHEKLRQIIHRDFQNFLPIASELAQLDACFWCLGVSSVGKDEAAYTRITHDYTVAAAKVLHQQSPELCFCFVSGQGTDETESSRNMWARVKGKAENAVRSTGFRDAAMFRPGFVLPAPGFTQRIALYRIAQPLLLLLNPLLRLLGGATSAIEIGKAMITVTSGADHEPILDSRYISRLAAE
jgi:hypothetical protein